MSIAHSDYAVSEHVTQIPLECSERHRNSGLGVYSTFGRYILMIHDNCHSYKTQANEFDVSAAQQEAQGSIYSSRRVYCDVD